jgi:hypothetical protein
MAYVVEIAMILAVNVAIMCGYHAHWQKVMKDIIADEKQKVWEDADAEIEAHAEERAKEILNSIQYTKRVELINESDINWGEK